VISKKVTRILSTLRSAAMPMLIVEGLMVFLAASVLMAMLEMESSHVILLSTNVRTVNVIHK